MNDYKLLKLAAKANRELYTEPLGDGLALSNGQAWNPLQDDGDALRLAVKLGFLVEVNYGEENQKVIVWDYSESERRTYEYWGETTGAISSDPYAATRRAIVRAAAEIGRSMK